MKALRSYSTRLEEERSITSPIPQGKKVHGEHKSDEHLWKDFKSGDESAFIAIYKEYANTLYNYGAKFSSDKELVQDCLQDFFLYLRRSRNKLSDTNSIKLYLLKSFRRRVIEYVNKSTNQKRKFIESAEFNLNVEVSDEVKFINQQVQIEQSQKLKKALSNLDSKEREAVFHFYYEGMSYKEIAEILDFTHVSSARRLIYRALRNLRGLMTLALSWFAMQLF